MEKAALLGSKHLVFSINSKWCSLWAIDGTTFGQHRPEVSLYLPESVRNDGAGFMIVDHDGSLLTGGQ